jgi:site-specific recombinase XerD
MSDRNRIFPPHYSNRYEASPVRDWLLDFDAWLSRQGYNRVTHRTHLSVVRYVLEQHPPVNRQQVFAHSEFRLMFQPFEQDSFRRFSINVFRRFLAESGQWRDDTPAGPCADLVEAFWQHGIHMRGLSDSYQRRQAETIDDFLRRTLESGKTLVDVAMADIESYVAYCAQFLQHQTVTKRICNLRAFFRFCRDRGVSSLNADGIDVPRKYRYEKPPRAIAWELTQQLLASIDRSSLLGERDYTLLYLMAHYGLRTGEAATLTLDSIDWPQHTLHVVQSKTRSTLILPMAEQVEQVLCHHVRHGRPVTERRELFLILTAPIRPMSASAINAMFQRRVCSSNLPLKGASPYGLRHGFAMRLLERGVGIKAIGDLMGHASLESTSVYLRLHTEALRGVALALPAGTVRRATS